MSGRIQPSPQSARIDRESPVKKTWRLRKITCPGRALKWGWPCVAATIQLVAGLGLLLSNPVPAAAQGVSDFQGSYINPFPGGDRYRIVVLGDSLGDGLWSGLDRSFHDDNNVEVVKQTKVSTGFTRPDSYDWNASLDDILKSGPYQIAVVMIGSNDDQAMRVGKDWAKPGTDQWSEAYGQRVETFIKKLRAAGLAVYWVGLPVMRSPDQSDDAEAMNDVFREKAFINGAKYIETWSGFTDESGRYSAYGPDMQGQVRRLRDDDGVHFTMRGYLKLAHFVEKEIRRDLALAKLERDIPLAGSEDEQAKVMGHQIAPKKSGPVVADGNATDAGAAPANNSGAGATASSDGAATPGQTSQPGKAKLPESTVGGVSVVRPEISANTLEAVQNLTPQAAASMPESETVASDIDGGDLTALASVSSLNDLSGSSKPKLPLTQRPYYKVLIQGEQLKPKAGRADDFTWPAGG